jgi:hypothetical protein
MMKSFVSAAFAILVTGNSLAGAEPIDFNKEVIATVEWLARNKSGLGYDLHSRYTENLQYGDYTFRATGGGKTMCVAAVFEILVRTLAAAKAPDGKPVSSQLLRGQMLDGSKALNVAPYVYQYKANVKIPEYSRPFSAGIGDALVLFGIGRYVGFDFAKAGDFLYLNRKNGGGHATIFISYLGADGKPTSNSLEAKGFRYFSAQQIGTGGFGYRDAFFNDCSKAPTQYVKDCGIIRSDNKKNFAVSRLHDPAEWLTRFSAIRIERFFKGESIEAIYADEPTFRSRSIADLTDAERRAREYAEKGLFPLIVPKIQADTDAARRRLDSTINFTKEFGPNFTE